MKKVCMLFSTSSELELHGSTITNAVYEGFHAALDI